MHLSAHRPAYDCRLPNQASERRSNHGRANQNLFERKGHAHLLVQRCRRYARPTSADAAPGHQGTGDTGRSGADIPDEHHHAGGHFRAICRDSRRSSGHSPVMAAFTAVQSAPSRKGVGHSGEDLLQVRGCESGGQPQAQHGRRPGVLQQARGRQTHRHRNRRRTVGKRAVDGLRFLRDRMQGLHGEGQLLPEAVPPQPDGGVGRDVYSQPE